ncbi:MULTISPECIES: hypothetical protein [Actinomadura]|uniref:Uncharacterized protein n=1 Tax=Actinomadura yumaensis TaxID=111807 RepID=A0ABW2CXA3_9ACTN|nr:hypothetical protein [Actinomadura sp. J1-007]MWK39548.1 hypothetical protein [Actinomadura sp. J1-007]
MTEPTMNTEAETGWPPYGSRVVATKRDTTRTVRKTGVLLPPAKPSGPARLHTDTDRLLRLPRSGWMVAPETPTVEQRRSRARTLCPQGRPVYRWNDELAPQLATSSMLRRARRRPAEGQEPIASYLITGKKDYAPLYAVADTVPLPALSPARAAAWDRARTCARCGTRRRDFDGPYAAGRDGARYCGDCQEPAAERWWHAERDAGRAAAGAWARGVLDAAAADPSQVALAAIGYATLAYVPITATTWDGQPLISAKVGTSPDYPSERYARPADVIEQLRALQGRRLIVWRDEPRNLERLLEAVRREVPDAGDLALALAEGDQAGRHWDEWIAARGPGVQLTHPFRLQWWLHQQHPPSWDPPELLGHVQHVVCEMASITGPYWWRATCLDPGCGLAPRAGTSRAAKDWADQHHADTGHQVLHTTEPSTPTRDADETTRSS